MDVIAVPDIWQIITEIQKHTAAMNSELTTVIADITWLKQSWWELLSWMRMIVGGVVVGILLNIWTLLIARNNRKNER